VIALDVGGTSVKSALVTSAAQLVQPPRTTPLDAAAPADVIFGALAEAIKLHAGAAFTDNLALLGCGFGFPGPFDYSAGISQIRDVAKFDSLYGLDIAAGLRRHLPSVLQDLPIRFRNDAEAAIVGEALYGAGRAYRRVIGVTLGTGCGSAFLVDGEPVTSGVGVPPNGWLYACLYNGVRADDQFSIRGLTAALTKAGVQVASIRQAAALARTNELRAQAVFRAFANDLGNFLRPYAEDFNADVILLQGGIARSFDLLEPGVAAALPIPVVAGELGQEAALFGAAAPFLS
jgi:glucokinase